MFCINNNKQGLIMLINNNNPTITMCINIVSAQSGGSCSGTRTTDLDGYGSASSNTTARTSGSTSKSSNTRATPLRGPGFSGFGVRLIPRERGTLRALRIPVASATPTPAATASLRRPGGNTDGQRHRLRRRAGRAPQSSVVSARRRWPENLESAPSKPVRPAHTTPYFVSSIRPFM